jgi:glyoxylase-like metal-dependent hydrolase (beta-lactamase superfamily II)
MHGDHFLDAEHLRKTRGAAIWTHERVADLLERPLDYDYDAMIPSYRERPTGDQQSLKVDRVIRDGEVIRWRGHDLACDWMPGQTEFACCVHGVIDGKRVAFTGDNIFGSPADPAQHGHEAVVARNSCTIDEGYGFAGKYLHGIAPDLILGGHSWAIENPKPLIDRYLAATEELREAFRDLTKERDERLAAISARCTREGPPLADASNIIQGRSASAEPAIVACSASPARTIEPEVLLKFTPDTLVSVALFVAVPAAPVKSRDEPLVGTELFVQLPAVPHKPDPAFHP